MNIYEEMGLRTAINACGTVTLFGGSLMDPKVLEAMTLASKYFVEITKLHKAAGEKIAKLLNVEACCITSGAAAGIAISAAACLTRGNIAKVLQLPDTTSMPSEALVLKCHGIAYDQALLLSGVKLIEIGRTSSANLEQVEAAINDNIAFFFYATEAETMRGSINLKYIIPIMQKHNIPIIVDAAAELPPKSNINKYLDMGADLVVFSGGKELRGPQSSGLILGKKYFIDACDKNCCPNHGIGRSMKIDKETIIGITKAVEIFVEKDYDVQMCKWLEINNSIVKLLSNCSNIEIRQGFPTEPGIQPTSILRIYVKPTSMTSKEMHDRLKDGSPSVFVSILHDEIVINPQCIEDNEINDLVDAIKSIL